MTSFSRTEQLADQPQPRLSADHPGVDEFFALLAYAEVAAFYRLTEEARMAPNLRGRISMAQMAAAEMGHFELLCDALESRGVDVVAAMSKYAAALDDYTAPGFLTAERRTAIDRTNALRLFPSLS